ncbi:MAG TPA: hypothetical protein ENJ50_02085, partial [Planctomycetaceae bacterium]|nr:hypothetical protein [Planctomycetaceae bacterium]
MGAGRRIIGAATILLAGWGLAHWFRPAKQDGVAESESLPLLAAHPASATGARALPDVEDVAVSRTAERSGAATETKPSAAGPRPPERSAAESGSLRTSTRAAGRHTELAFRGPSRPPQMASSYAEAVARTAQVLACRPVVSGGGL